jgi:hypothetical protein
MFLKYSPLLLSIVALLSNSISLPSLFSIHHSQVYPMIPAHPHASQLLETSILPSTFITPTLLGLSMCECIPMPGLFYFT